jgi:hypothetical protein
MNEFLDSIGSEREAFAATIRADCAVLDEYLAPIE